MLRKFVYLDETSLAEYTATLEGGLIAETKTTSSKKGSKGGKLNVKVVAGNLSSDDETKHEWSISDQPQARFERLLDAANTDPEAIGWIDVMDPDAHFTEAAIGDFVSWACDVYVPEIFRVVAATGDAGRSVKLAEGILETMKKGVEAKTNSGADDADAQAVRTTALEMQLDTVKQVLAGLQGPRKIVGEDPEVTQWKVFGPLNDEHIHDQQIDDRLVVVGKIKRILTPGRWQSLIDVPLFFESVSRAERRRREREAVPQEGQEENFIHGPALLLDVLAIYR